MSAVTTKPSDPSWHPLREVRAGDRWLVPVAHPDDESFGCGSVIAHAASRGAQVTVVCATRGEAGEASEQVVGYQDLGTLREQELRRAAARLGVADVVLLDYKDSGYQGELPVGSLCAVPLAEVSSALQALVQQVRPQVVVVLDGSDGHRDHLRIREAARRALQDAGPGSPWLFEHCLPNHLMRRWLEEMRALRPGTAYHEVDPTFLGRTDSDITEVLDVSQVLDRREAAMGEHRSQSSPFEGLSPELRADFLRTDHLALVLPGPTPGADPVETDGASGRPASAVARVPGLADISPEHPVDRSQRYWDVSVAAWVRSS